MSAAIVSATAPGVCVERGPFSAPDVSDDFWDHPRTSAEIRARLRTALMEELSYEGKRRTLAVARTYGLEPIHRSPGEILFLVDELVAQVRREERARAAVGVLE
jgi:hypothetical protein